MATEVHYTMLTILDARDLTEVDADRRDAALREMHERGTMRGCVFARLAGQSADCAEWGPDASDIDWTGYAVQ